MTYREKQRIALLAGRGDYPITLIAAAKKKYPQLQFVIAGFEDNTDDALANEAVAFQKFKIGHVGKLLKFLESQDVSEALMAGQIKPSNLFNLFPDIKGLMMLAKLKQRNAETIFGAFATELSKIGINLLPATTFMDEHLVKTGLMYGPKIKSQQRQDITFGFSTMKTISTLDIGQSIVVRQGTVLAVEAFEGTNDCILRGGNLGRGKKCVLVKVSKPQQDLRFDVPVIGKDTVLNCAQAGIQTIACESNKTILLQQQEIATLCQQQQISLYGIEEDTNSR